MSFAAGTMEGFEGHVAQYLGDGVLVYFGYPQAHEDDAERAVRAGLELVAGLPAFNQRLEAERGLRLSIRIGIHTGPVVVGEMGDGARRETLALGDTTMLAARPAIRKFPGMRVARRQQRSSRRGPRHRPASSARLRSRASSRRSPRSTSVSASA